jgi:glycosyltransferase involved in cell wall biosynthesis
MVHLLNRLLTNQLLALDLPRTRRVLHANTYCLQGTTFELLSRRPDALSGVIANAPTLLAEIKMLLATPRLPAIVLPSAVDPGRFRPGVMAKRWDMIWTGYMRSGDAKRLDLLLIDVATRADASLALIGDGDARPRLEQLADQRRPRAKIEFLGWHPQASLPDLLNQARLYVTTADFDPAPRGVTEALACGLPALGLSTCRGLEEQIRPGENGLLADDGDELSCLARHLLDRPGLQETMGRASRRIALETFDPERRRRRLLHFLSQLASPRSSPHLPPP